MEAARATEIIKRFSDAASNVAGVAKKYATPFWKVLTFSPSETVLPASCLCAEIGKGYVSILYARRTFSKYRVKAKKTYQFEEGAFPSPEEVASTMAVAFKDFRIRKADVILVIPKLWVMVKSASLPAAVEENLREVVAYEFDRFTPFSAEEALYDYLADNNTKEEIDLVIAAVKSDTITGYIDRLLERGIVVSTVSFDVSCIATLCRFVMGLNSFDFIEVDEIGVKFGSVRDGTLRAAASQEFKCDDNLLRAVIIEDFLAEQKASSVSSHENGQLLISFRGQMDSLMELLKSRGNISFQVLNGIDHKIGGLLDMKLVSLAVVGGITEQLWPKSRGFNLLSKGLRRHVKMPFLLTSLLALAMVACLGVYLFVPIQTEKDRLGEIERQINLRKNEVRTVEKIKNDIEAIKKKTALINNFKHVNPLYIDLLKELTLVIPKNAWLTRVRIAGPQVNAEGYAPSATSLIQLLEASKHFQKVEFSSPTFRDARLNMDRFQIKMDIKGFTPEVKGNEKK